MTLRDEEVLPAVVVVIEEPRAPAREGQRGAAHAGRVRRVAKAAVVVLAKEPVALVREIGDDDVGPAVVVVVGEVHAHAGEGLAVLVEADAGKQADLAERAVPVVVIQERLHRVVRHVDVHEAVAIVVGKGDAEALAVRIGDAGLRRDIGERAVAVVAVEDVR